MADVDAEAGPGAVSSTGVDVKIGAKTVHLGAEVLERVTVDILLREGGYEEAEEYDLFVAGQDEPLDREIAVRITEGMQLRPIRRSNPYGK